MNSSLQKGAQPAEHKKVSGDFRSPPVRQLECAPCADPGPYVAPIHSSKHVLTRLLCNTVTHASKFFRVVIDHYQGNYFSMDNEGTELVEAYGTFALLSVSSTMLVVLTADDPASFRLLIQVHRDR